MVKEVIVHSRTVSFINVASKTSWFFSAYWLRTFKFTFENQEVRGVDSLEALIMSSKFYDFFVDIFLERV